MRFGKITLVAFDMTIVLQRNTKKINNSVKSYKCYLYLNVVQFH